MESHRHEPLRELARRIKDAAADPCQREKIDLWTRKMSLEHVRPLVLIFPEGAWDEVTADWQWRTEDGFYRSLERDLRMRLYYVEHLKDDSVVEPVVHCPIVVQTTGYGLNPVHRETGQQKGAYQIEPVLIEESDIEKITIPELHVDWDATKRDVAHLEESLDGILRVEVTLIQGGYHRWTPMDVIAKWRGIQQLFMDLVEKPEWIHAIMSRLLKARLSELDQLYTQGALTLNNKSYYNGSGGLSYTRELPQPDFDGMHVRTKDMWGYAAAQVFSGVSPQMHEEFSFPYERRFLECFGLTHYGCCEPLHDKVEYLKKISNLRVVSICPWADVAKSVERLGDSYVFSWKPNPVVIAASRWNPDEVRRSIREFLDRSRGCITQIVMKDTHACAGEPHRLSEWVRIAKEEVDHQMGRIGES
jgi:hypothetical protein